MEKQDELAQKIANARFDYGRSELPEGCSIVVSDLDHRIAAAVRSFMGSPAAGPWMKVGSFEPDSDALYLVQGTMRTSVKQGRDIDGDNVAAALIDLSAAIGEPEGALRNPDA